MNRRDERIEARVAAILDNTACPRDEAAAAVAVRSAYAQAEREEDIRDTKEAARAAARGVK